MNQKNFKEYYIGLDIGTESLGYAVAKSNYSLCKLRGEPMMGVDLFEASETVKNRRWIQGH